MAQFENEISDKFLALYLGDEKVVLRDDGKGADMKENDHQYAIYINEDIEGLKAHLLKKQKEMLSKNENFTFKKRRQVLIDRKIITEFNIENMRVGQLIDVPIELVIGAINLRNQQKTFDD